MQEKSKSIIGLKGIEYFEDKYSENKAKYVADLCLKDHNGNWANEPSAIFYQENPPKGYSNYFGIIVRGKKTFITSGLSAVESPISGIIADDGEVIFSAYRHDYVTSKDGSVFIDGGRDYVKCSDPSRLVTLKIINGEILVSQQKTNKNKM